ncbi:hypothetical protein Pint_26555 [Pistacia integerrima]|uniref:Uncharacterized protein n=1 Tax=Pistacia integerrima TaxID=434235 RepID=A0ACC0YQ07_9ROSI|nr:hypothetical protein Pint_26555 [Pistacia integerrima]
MADSSSSPPTLSANTMHHAPSPTIIASDGTSKTNPAYTSWLDTDQTLHSLLYSFLMEEFMTMSEDLNGSEWFLDSGATSHMTSDIEGVDQLVVYSHNERVMVGNGQALTIPHIGSISSLVPS